jgi:uncharacterized protein with HEPN domain
MRSDRERLLDILEAIERIERYIERGRTVFEQDELVQTWVLHHMQIIGEACRGLSHSFVTAHAKVPWSSIIGMRNVLVHHYFGIDLEAVWNACETNLPKLKADLELILRQMPDEE